MKDYYYILGIEKTASQEVIKKAYKKLSKKFHPDLNDGDKYFENRFKDILEAYEILNSKSKSQYDKLLSLHQNKVGNITSTLADLENKIRQEYEELLKNKAEEIKKRFWTEEQYQEEENRKQEEKNRILRQQKISLLNEELREIEKQSRSLLSRVNEIDEERTQLMTLLESNNLKKNKVERELYKMTNISHQNTNSNQKNDYVFSYEKELKIQESIMKIKSQINLDKREVFLLNLLNYVKDKTVNSKFAKENPQLTELILNSEFNNNHFKKVYEQIGNQEKKKDLFEESLFYVITL